VTISRSAEYALRAVVWLASNPARKLSTLVIAKGTRVPAGYLSKVLQTLARAGIVESCAGRSGGFALSNKPAAMTVLDVVNAVDPVKRIHTCPLNVASHQTNLCPLHRSLDQVAESTQRAFGQITIAQLLAADSTSVPLCDNSAKRAPRRRSKSGCAAAGRRRRGDGSPRS